MTDDFDFHGLDGLDPNDLQHEEAVIIYANELKELFDQSPEAQALEVDDHDRVFWPYELIILGFETEGVRVDRADAGAVRQVVLEIWPRLLHTTDKLHPEQAIPTLVGFWRFLQRAFEQPHADEVLAMLPELEAEFLARMQDPRDASRLGPRPAGVPAVNDLSAALDLAAIAGLNPATEDGRNELLTYCSGAVHRFYCAPEGEAARRYPQVVTAWLVNFLAESVLQGMASWPGELGAEDAEEVLLHGLPDKVMIPARDADEVVSVLQDFWRYLGRVHKLPNAGLIVSTLGAQKARFQEILAAREPGDGDLDRAIERMAGAAGLDMDDPRVRAAVTEDVKGTLLQELPGVDLDDLGDPDGVPAAGGMGTLPTRGGGGDPDKKKKRKAAKAARKANKQKKKKK